MKSVLDPSFKYTRSIETNLRKTFKRVRREQSAAGPRKEANSAPTATVVPLNREASTPASSVPLKEVADRAGLLKRLGSVFLTAAARSSAKSVYLGDQAHRQGPHGRA